MFRKTTLALAAAATLAATAIPTSASAHWTGWRHHHRHHNGVVVRYSAPRHVYTPRYSYVPRYSYATRYAYAPHCFVKKRWVRTHWGWRVNRVRVCR